MQYIRYGSTDLEVSRFGLGCMRFPNDTAEAIEMVRYAIDHGVTYLDTAYVYEGSEAVLGKALKGGYREKIKLVTKAPMWNIDTYTDFETYLDEQLVRLNTDYLDVYLLHNLFGSNWARVQRNDGFAFLEEMVQKGKIRAKGFSAHCSYEAFKEIIDAHPWDMAQLQLNILDTENQVGLAGLMYGAAKGMAMVIMEPLRGGSMVTSMPQRVTEILDAYPEKRSLVEWAFRWLYDKPEVGVILSGTSTLEQLKDNLRIFENAQTGCMSEADQELIAQIVAEYEAQTAVACTECRYCMPCPQGVAIPDVFKHYNNFKLYNDAFIEKLVYSDSLLEKGVGVDKCIECGVCEDVCPQHLPIIESLKRAHSELNIPGKTLSTFRRTRD